MARRHHLDGDRSGRGSGKSKFLWAGHLIESTIAKIGTLINLVKAEV